MEIYLQTVGTGHLHIIMKKTEQSQSLYSCGAMTRMVTRAYFASINVKHCMEDQCGILRGRGTFSALHPKVADASVVVLASCTG